MSAVINLRTYVEASRGRLLVMVDLQEKNYQALAQDDAPGLMRALDNCMSAIRHAREFSIPIAFTRAGDGPGVLERSSAWISGLEPRRSDMVFERQQPSCYSNQLFESVVSQAGSFAIAGLLQTRNRQDVSQLPWIGSVPVIGSLFSSKSYQQEETDLVIIVTPRLVAPAAPGQQLASPLDSRLPANDVDFFLNGQMEVRKRYNDYVNSGGEVKGPYGHIIAPQINAPALPPAAAVNVKLK